MNEEFYTPDKRSSYMMPGYEVATKKLSRDFDKHTWYVRPIA